MNFFKYHCKRFRYRRRRLKELEFLDFGQKENQYFLVSYPKSGNTWLRFLLANLLCDEPEREISFHNVGEFIPDSHSPIQRDYIKRGGDIFGSLRTQVVKSHDEYRRFFSDKRVIYLIRNGANVSASFFHYLNARLESEVLFKDVVRGRASRSFGAWFGHVLKWINKSSANRLFVRYEELREDPQGELKRIASFLRLDVTSEMIERAISRSSLSRMKELEKKYGYFNDNRTKAGKSVPFVRNGSIQRVNFDIPSDLVGLVDLQQQKVEEKLQQL